MKTWKQAYILGCLVGVVFAVFSVALLYTDFLTRREAAQEAESHVQRGIQLFQQGALAEAEAALNKSLHADPDEWRAPYYLGVIKTFVTQSEQAIPYLERAYALNPTEPKIPNALGVAYYKLGRLDLAKGYFAASLTLDPANKDTRGMVDNMVRLQRRARLAEETEPL